MRSTSSILTLWNYRELFFTLVWKEIVVRYKQAYFGMALSVLKPVLLTAVFTLLRSLINFNTGPIPYPLLTFSAMLPWVFFQEGVSQGVNSVVNNAVLIKKIYFPRELFPLVAVGTKCLEFCIDLVILLILMVCYGYYPGMAILWLGPLLIYLILTTLAIGLAGAALNVFYRDISQLLPVGISLLMYASPILYPISLVKQTLLINHASSNWSYILYNIYTANPIVGIIDGFQKAVLERTNPDLQLMWRGMLVVAILFPVSLAIFKKAEAHFSDVI